MLLLKINYEIARTLFDLVRAIPNLVHGQVVIILCHSVFSFISPYFFIWVPKVLHVQFDLIVK